MLAFSRTASLAVLLGLLGAASSACDPNLPPDTEVITEARPRIRVPDPVPPAGENESRNLLQEYVGRERIKPDEPPTWDLPFKSKRVVVALLITAAHDRLEELPLILAPDARWGLPDSRMFHARPIFDGDDGERFFQAFRKAASRLPHDAKWPPLVLPPGMSEAVRSGAEPMWMVTASDDERIYFRMVFRDGRAWIDYVGFFEELPDGPIRLVGQGHPPPLTPPIRASDGRIHMPQNRPPQGPPPVRAPAAPGPEAPPPKRPAPTPPASE